MNDPFESGAEASHDEQSTAVQTSAQAVADLQKEPAEGGSYIRNPETGELSKSEPVVEQTEQE